MKQITTYADQYGKYYEEDRIAREKAIKRNERIDELLG